MAGRPQLILTALRAFLRSDGGFDFWAHFNTARGPRQIMIAPESMLSYHQFQLCVLRRTGMVFTHLICEGRSPEAANEAWRSITALVEYAPEPAESPPAGMENSPVH